MPLLLESFEERLQEVEEYLDLLAALEQQLQSGAPRSRTNRLRVTVSQQRMLYASVFLQLYNLIESTARKCIDALVDAARSGNWKPSDLAEKAQRDWVRAFARTYEYQRPEARLTTTMKLFEHLDTGLSITEWDIEKNSGTWDDLAIEALCRRLGLTLNVTPETNQLIKRDYRFGGRMESIKHLRNQLAHGKLTFVECGEGQSADDLRQLTNAVAQYLREVMTSFDNAIVALEFIHPNQRHLGGRP